MPRPPTALLLASVAAAARCTGGWLLPHTPGLSTAAAHHWAAGQTGWCSTGLGSSSSRGCMEQEPKRAKLTTMASAEGPTCSVTITPSPSWEVHSEPPEGRKTIGTHSGSFHCDEALACGMLLSLPAWRDAVVVRTRDSAALERCDIVVDVGGVYDAPSHRYDHHQKSFHGTMSELGGTTRLSSAGLVYRHFGREFVRVCLEGCGVPDDVIDNVIYKKVYKNFMEEVDGNDNGVNPYDGSPRYVTSSSLGARVGALNPSWNEDSSASAANARFATAIALTLCEARAYVRSLGTSWWPARAIVAAALDACDAAAASRDASIGSGAVLVLGRYCPWKDHLHDLERERGAFGRTKFVLYAENPSAESSAWRVQTVPLADAGFENRMPLAPAWWGLREGELDKVSGIDGGVFVHANGFIGGNRSRAGALAMALESLRASGEEW